MNIAAICTQEVLERISRHCPRALSVYLQCINRANEDGIIFFSRNAIDIDMSEDWNTFRRRIKELARENVLEWLPLDGGIYITLAPN